MKELIVTGNELFVIVTDMDNERVKQTGYSQFAIGPLEEMVVEGKKLSRLDQAGYWIGAFNQEVYGPKYEALMVVGAVAKMLFPNAIRKLAEDMEALFLKGAGLDNAASRSDSSR